MDALLISCDRVAELMAKSDEQDMKFLMSYQKFILTYFMSKAFENKCLLMLYMEVGTGKTLTSLVCGVCGIKSGKFKRIVVLSPKSVQDEFVKNLELFYKLAKVDDRNKLKDSQFIMLPYNANNSGAQFKRLGNLEHTLFIIDEAHLFMKSVIKVSLMPNTKVRNIGNAKRIYDIINKLKNKKVLLLTGTPATKHPFETVPMWNLAGCDMPSTFEDFCERYINNGELDNVGELKRKLNGLVAYVGSRNINYPNQVRAKKLEVIDVPMSAGQYRQYLYDYALELEEKGFTNKRNVYGLLFGAKSSFHAKTFEDSIYWNENLTNQPKEDRYTGSIVVDVKHMPKVLKMIEDAEQIHGTCVMYFRFVRMYGADAMCKALEKMGYMLCEKDASKVFEKPAKRYVLFTGDVDYSRRIAWKHIFNDSRNKYGDYVKYLVLSPSGSVGITLKNVRFLGIGSCEFQYSTIRQIMGRCNRLNSHLDLPDKDRTLTNKLYLASKNKKVYEDGKKHIDKVCERRAPGWNETAPTIERCIYQDSIFDDMINEKFRELLRGVSIIK